MKGILFTCFLVIATTSAFGGDVNPAQDLNAFQKYFSSKFPNLPFREYINGVYAIDAESRSQWQEIEEFPPYELSISEGESEWKKPFSNGKTYQSCFPWPVNEGIRSHYPHWDVEHKRVVTLERALNECREANSEKPLEWEDSKLVGLSAYLAFHSRGKAMNVTIPNEEAKHAYAEGKHFFYTKRGQLNVSCADCHVYNASQKIRADILSPALGHASHFPVYRSEWEGIGGLHRRFVGCNKNVRAKPFQEQGVEYSNLEYFLTYMNNGLSFNGPAVRK